jgi:hypothetical protein
MEKKQGAYVIGIQLLALTNNTQHYHQAKNNYISQAVLEGKHNLNRFINTSKPQMDRQHGFNCKAMASSEKQPVFLMIAKLRIQLWQLIWKLMKQIHATLLRHYTIPTA